MTAVGAACAYCGAIGNLERESYVAIRHRMGDLIATYPGEPVYGCRHVCRDPKACRERQRNSMSAKRYQP